MTMPHERYLWLACLEKRLTDLACQRGPIRKRELREEVYSMLRHFPTRYDIDRLAKACPDILEKTK